MHWFFNIKPSLIGLFLTIALFKKPVYTAEDLDWWQTASIYQIYPRSFRDSDGDGIGDLNGITENLQYLKQLGIAGAWLSPIFKSPMADFGYDISDFYSIQPEYGTMDDFDRLIERAKEWDIKIFLDFVPNHSSDENEWFKKSVKRDKNYEDFYIWHSGYPAVDNNKTNDRLPPSNWISVFRKSAWTWNEERQQFYLHQFLSKQPDLNYRNPIVVEEMKSVLRFWLNRGVDGFRVDAVPHLFEIDVNADDGKYLDEPISGDIDDPDDYAYLKHIYTKDQSETIDMVYQWRAVLDEYQKENGGSTRILLTEAYTNIETLMKYFGNETHNGAQIPFNFGIISAISNQSNAHDYVSVINDWLTNLPEGRTSNWVFGNHDNSRVGSRLGKDRIDSMNMMLLTLPGVSITYYGEEIGMTDQWLSWDDTVDPAACNSNPQIYEKFSRDPARTPFQWDDGMNAGFSNATKTWLPIADNYKTINTKNEFQLEKSYLRVYLRLMSLRETTTLRFGNCDVTAINDNVIIILRYLKSDYTFVTIINIGDKLETINLNDIPMLTTTLLYTVVSVNSYHEIGSMVTNDNIILKPKESFVLRNTVKLKEHDPELYSILNVKQQNYERISTIAAGVSINHNYIVKKK